MNNLDYQNKLKVLELHYAVKKKLPLIHKQEKMYITNFGLIHNNISTKSEMQRD